jgi:TolA-binding protein
VTKNLLVALLTLTSSGVLAQPAETPTATSTPPATESTSAQATESTPAQADTPTTPSTDDRLTTAEGKIAAIEEGNIETKSDLSALKKLKFSGYIQARYQAQQSLDETGAGSFNRFLIRRGRLKDTYTGDVAHRQDVSARRQRAARRPGHRRVGAARAEHRPLQRGGRALRLLRLRERQRGGRGQRQASIFFQGEAP